MMKMRMMGRSAWSCLRSASSEFDAQQNTHLDTSSGARVGHHTIAIKEHSTARATNHPE